MSGKVILAQGPNILRGSSLVINLATGRAELTSQGGAGGRVEGVFVPTKNAKGAVNRSVCRAETKLKPNQSPDTSRNFKAKWDFMSTFNE